jgi:hypothetical protein
MGEDDVQIRELGGDIVDRHRVGVLQPDAGAPGHPRADAGCAGVKERDQTSLGDHVIEREERTVVGPERLDVGVEFETPCSSFDQLMGFADSQLALVRVDRRERDQNVRVGACCLKDLVAPQPPATHTRFVVDVEDDRREFALPVVVGDLLCARLRRAAAEVVRGCVQELQRYRVLGLAGVSLCVDVDVDRDDAVEIDRHLSFKLCLIACVISLPQSQSNHGRPLCQAT